MRKLLVHLKNYKKECVLGPLFKLLEAAFELLVPMVIAMIIDVGVGGGDRPYIVRMCGILFGFALLGLVCALTAQYFAAKAAVGFSASLRHSLMGHLQTLSYAEIDSLGTSTMITRITSDVNQLQNGVNLALRLLLRSPFIVFGAMVMAFLIDWQAALVFAVVIPLLCAVVFGIMLWTLPRYQKIQNRLDGLTRSTRENLSGVRVIRAFCREEEEERSFREKNDALTLMQNVVGKISALLNPVTYVLINCAVIALIWVGAIRVYSGTLTQGEVVALYNYMSQILVELIKMANLIITMTKAAACGDRISDVLAVFPSQKDGDMIPEDRSGRVEFSDVCLAYHAGGEEALSSISFVAEPGATVGVIGGTGSGKSTLVNLISRFYDCTSGRVIVDGVDVKDFSSGELRRRIGVVPQKAVLFNGTVRSNLLWGNEAASDSELIEALKTAQAADFLEKKEGLDTKVAQGGKNFSGGQRQRLTIARALVKKPEILILDDSSSALDYLTDANLRSAIRKTENPPTTFIVSQRAASVMDADVIIVLENGKTAGIGRHEQLLESCPVYREIYSSQFVQESSSRQDKDFAEKGEKANG